MLSGLTDTVQRAAPLFWERGGNKAVRWGKWKLVSPAGLAEKYELFDIEKDRAENADVAAQHPEIVAQLKAAYVKWAAENGVVDYELLKTAPTRPVQGNNRGNQNF